MNFQEAEQFLYSLSNLPRKEYMKDPRDCKNYLKRMQFFLDLIGNPEKKIPHYIHIAGTSGKGSLANFLHSILDSSGLKTGSYISPHPTEITERWKIGKKQMTKKEFSEIISTFKKALDKYLETSPYGPPSFFDMTTAIALYWFAKQKVKWVILEAGCGGRYDSTNIIPQKDIAVITNVGLDHTHILGNTKAEIADKKSGIIKKGCAVFTQEKDKKILEVIKKASKPNSLFISKPKFELINYDKNGSEFIYQSLYCKISSIGQHQIANAILAIDIAKHLKINEASLLSGLRTAKQVASMELVSKKPDIILDSAHNFDKMKTTVEAMDGVKNIHLIIGFCQNKDISQMIKLLSRLDLKSIACTRNTVNQFRKVAHPYEIAKLFKKQLPKIKTRVFSDPKDALIWSRSQAQIKSTVLTTGSIFLSGELRKI